MRPNSLVQGFHFSGDILKPVFTSHAAELADLPLDRDIFGLTPETLSRYSQQQGMRIAAYLGIAHLLNELYAIAPTSISFANYLNGAPYICVDSVQLNISLSHISGNVVVALASKASCFGIDIVRDKQRSIEGLLERVLTPREYQLLELWGNRRATFFFLWCLKESAQKAWGVGMQLAPWEIEILLDNKGYITIQCITEDTWPILEGRVWQIEKHIYGAYAWSTKGALFTSKHYTQARSAHFGCC